MSETTSTTRYKVMILCPSAKENPPIVRDDEDTAIHVARMWLHQHRHGGCKAAVIKETRYEGGRSEYEHIATFYYQALAARPEDAVYSDRE